jgi:hypothetical protein
MPGVFALMAWLLYFVPGLAGAYGAFIDEHYYVACANRLAWGYVDHAMDGNAHCQPANSYPRRWIVRMNLRTWIRFALLPYFAPRTSAS